jgi:hypothetical protein
MNSDDLLLESGVDSIVLVASRDEVERIDLSRCLQVLDSLIESRERAMRFRDQMVFTVDGYNDDPRELFEIPEVRTFIRELDARWQNFLPYFLLPFFTLKYLIFHQSYCNTFSKLF